MHSPLLTSVLLFFGVPVALLAAPIPSSSTFFGGSGGDVIYGVAADPSGAVYVVGSTGSTNFPGTNSIAPGSDQTFVAKFSPDGRTLVYSTLIDRFSGRGIAVDAQGSAYLVGIVGGPNAFSISNNAQALYGGGGTDAAVIKLSASGAGLVYATYLGGNGDELAKAITVDDTGSAYIAGITTSTNFPATPGSAQTSSGGREDAFVAKLNPAGTAFVFASYLGGTNYEIANGLAVDGQHRVYVTGQTKSTNFVGGLEPHAFGPPDSGQLSSVRGNAFVARLSATGSNLEYLALIRGSQVENGVAVAVDSNGCAVVLGTTASPDFPVTTNSLMPAFQGWEDLFVVRLIPAGDGLQFATYLGGNSLEAFPGGTFPGEPYFGSIALDAAGDIYLCATTYYSAWPNARAIPVSGFHASGTVAKLHGDGSRLEWLRYLSGQEDNVAYGLALTPQGVVWVAGVANRPVQLPVFPTTESAYQNYYGGGQLDGFLVKLSEPVGAPLNNSFAGRLLLTRSPGTTPYSTAGATNDPNGRSLWWAWAAPADGFLTLRVDPTVTNAFTANLAVYTGPAPDDLTLVASNQQGETNSVRFPVSAGETYQIALGISADSVEGLLSLEFSAPLNDDFANSARIPSGIPATVTGSNVNATTQPGEANLNDYPWTSGYGHSVWWEWSSPSNVTVAISAAGSDFNVVVQAYTGDTLENLRRITSTPLDQITFDADAGINYQIAVFGWFDAFGSIQLSIIKAAPPVNDRFEDASLLIANAAPVSISSRNATPDPGEPALLGEGRNGLHSLWWKWTSPTRGYVRVSVSGGGFPPGIGAFTGPAIDQMELVQKSSRSDVYGGENEIRFATAQGVTYYVLVNDAISDPGGPVSVALQFAPFVILANTIRLSQNGMVSFAVAGETNVAYQIEMSTDLKTWTPASSGAFTGPDFTFEATTLTDSHRFYRISPAP